MPFVMQTSSMSLITLHCTLRLLDDVCLSVGNVDGLWLHTVQ